jgi:hypothetical protein
MSITRRRFISSSSAAAAMLYTGVGRAASLGLPVGLQLYSVRTLLPTDYAGTLKQVGALGYKEVEAAGFFNLPVEQVKAAMQAAGLRCVSAHYGLPLLRQHLDEILPFCKSLGRWICSLLLTDASAGRSQRTAHSRRLALERGSVQPGSH